ncbi:MAG: hypothetical protein JWL72_4594, partial [Ilumatobacteraceae bacterium]|nr:hypothetical protein [Ilumatobacteraceae bacterium]
MVVAVLVVGAAIFVYARSIGGSPSPSQELEATPTADTSNGLFPFDPPDAYTVTYRHVAYDGSDATTTTQQYSVARPFEARVVSLNGEPPGGGEQWSVTTTLGLYEQSTADDGATTQVAAPATGLGDYRLDASIDDLVTDGTFVRRVLRTLLGRQCQVYRTGSPAEAYTITAPTAENFVDLCIDHSGIVLEELAVASGAVSEHLVATAIDITPTLTDADFPITTAPSGSGTLNEIARDTSPVPGYWAMSTVPDG